MISFKEFETTIPESRKAGMDKYQRIMTMFNEIDNLSTSREFQKNFNGFYRIRRNATWQKVYYDFFNENRWNKDITFDKILGYIYDKTGRMEASFCSKMLHTINPDMPIWDKFVLKNLNIKVDNWNNKLENTIQAYKEIINWFNNELTKKTTKEEIQKFRKNYPNFNFSDVKIIDFFLWNQRN